MRSKKRLELLKERIDDAVQVICRDLLELEKIETGDIDPLRALPVSVQGQAGGNAERMDR